MPELRRRILFAWSCSPSIRLRSVKRVEITLEHLLVCYLEQADLRVLGELKTNQVMDFWAADHYTWVYQTIITRSRDVGQIVRDRKLIPAR
jgi:hypothetical protein